MSQLNFLCYRSAARNPFHSSDDLDILVVARWLNRVRGISGFLHKEDGFFLQYMEGHETALNTTYNAIVRDPRHHIAELVARGPTRRRAFADWDMGFSTPVDRSSSFSARFDGATLQHPVTLERAFAFLMARSQSSPVNVDPPGSQTNSVLQSSG